MIWVSFIIIILYFYFQPQIIKITKGRKGSQEFHNSEDIKNTFYQDDFQLKSRMFNNLEDRAIF